MLISGLCNLRASDILHTPVFYSYALVSKNNTVQLYLHNNRVSEEIENHFKNEGAAHLIQVKDYNDIVKGLTEFVSH